MGYIYLASPYSHPDPFVREDRYLRTMKELTRLLRLGIAVYSPIVHCHELAKIADLPRDAGFWMKYNFTMMQPSIGLWVLMLPSWEESKGIVEEVAEALKRNIPVSYFEEGRTPNEAEFPQDSRGSREDRVRPGGGELRPSEG